MAKKRGATNKSNASSVETVQHRASDTAADAPQPQQQQRYQQQVDDMSVDELRKELLAARAELESLKAGQGTAGQLAAKQPAEVQELRAKLAQLREEQSQADAAREKAWSQLKAVVTEISHLAQPDYLQSLVVSKAQE